MEFESCSTLVNLGMVVCVYPCLRRKVLVLWSGLPWWRRMSSLLVCAFQCLCECGVLLMDMIVGVVDDLSVVVRNPGSVCIGLCPRRVSDWVSRWSVDVKFQWRKR